MGSFTRCTYSRGFSLSHFFIAVFVLSEKVTLLKVLDALFIVAGVGLLGI